LLSKDDLPPPPLYLPRPLTPEDDSAVRKLLEAREGLLAKALLVLRATGLRRGELLELDRDCLQKTADGEWALYVSLGKLHSERVIPVDADTARLIEEIRALRGDSPPSIDPSTGKRKHFLVVWKNGRRPHPGTITVVLLKAGREAGCTERVTPHRFRHTYATELLRGGIPLPILQYLLGHRTIRMTLRYAEVTQQDIRRAYFQALENMKHLHQIPTPIGVHRQPQGPLTLDFVIESLDQARSIMDSFRQANGTEKLKKKAQRIAERIQRAARDFRTLYE
jgi:integrase